MRIFVIILILLAINIILYLFIVRRFKAFLKGMKASNDYIELILFLNSARENKILGEYINYKIFNKYEVKK